MTFCNPCTVLLQAAVAILDEAVPLPTNTQVSILHRDTVEDTKGPDLDIFPAAGESMDSGLLLRTSASRDMSHEVEEYSSVWLWAPQFQSGYRVNVPSRLTSYGSFTMCLAKMCLPPDLIMEITLHVTD